MSDSGRGKRLIGAWILLLCVIWTGTVSCRKEAPVQAVSVLNAMQAEAKPLPAGLVYDRRSDPAGKEYLSDVLFAALYGPAARGCFGEDRQTGEAEGSSVVPPLADDGALFLSAVPHPAELAVLRCPDPSSALSVAALFRERLETLRIAWAGTEYAEWVEMGQVTVVDGFVLFAVCPNAEAVLRAGAETVKR